MASCGFADAGSGTPPGPANWIDTVVAVAGVSSRKNDIVPGSMMAVDVSDVIGKSTTGLSRGMSDTPPEVV